MLYLIVFVIGFVAGYLCSAWINRTKQKAEDIANKITNDLKG